MAVADAFIGELVNRLVKLVKENNAWLVFRIKDQIDDLVDDLNSFKADLEQASKNRRANDVLKDVVDKIRNVVTDAEDAICMYTVERKKYTDKGIYRFLETPASYAKVKVAAREIETIRGNVNKIRQDHAQALQALIDEPKRDGLGGELIDRLAQVVEENASLIIGIKDQIDALVSELKSFYAYLRQASKNQRANDTDELKDVVDMIRNLVSDTRDAIGKYIEERKNYKDKGVWRYLETHAYYAKVHVYAREIQTIRGRVNKIRLTNAQSFQDLIVVPKRGTSTASTEDGKYSTMAFTDALEGEPVNRLVHVVDENASLITGIKDQIDDLVDDLKSLSLFLKKASHNLSANDNVVLADIEDKIRSVVSDAEDAICMYIVVRKKYKDKGAWRYLGMPAYYAKVDVSARGTFQTIKDKVMKIRREHAPALLALRDYPDRDQPAPWRMAPVVEEDAVVGFDNEAKIIKDRLIGGSNDLTVISIEGMAGLGKTTLAKMVFRDCEIEFEFFTRLWVYVSRTFNRKQIFLSILSNFTRYTDVFCDLSELKLAEKIREFLNGGKYFIVLDDLWTKDDWDSLRIAFPNNMKGSRVLGTTRHQNVALYADSACKPHKLKFLTNEESWELLQKKIFRKERCPPSLEVPGRRIATKCNGLPLAIVVIAGVLLDKDSTTTEWKRVAEDPFSVINQENQSYNGLVKLSYDDLPHYLKHCFLYLAAFPIGHEIVAWKLICLWIAEGFIPLMEGGYTSNLERTTEKYLQELVDRNLLMVLKRRADGQIKTCHIHDTLHQFCKTEAAKKNIFHEVDGAKLEVNKISRRLCVHSSILGFLKSESKPSSEHVRSFLSFPSTKIEIRNEHLAVIPKSFPILRVVDIESLNFKSLPEELYHLYHLRYLAVSTDLKLLPERFNRFENMHTLVFNTSQNSLDVKADIWSMPKLRHLCSNISMQLPPPKKIRETNMGSTDIQTLSTILPSSCTGEILEKTPNLQKLGIRGNLDELLKREGGISLFDNLQELCHLENLKLLNEAIGQASKLRSVPQHDKFPKMLRKLTLSNTSFEWKDMCILGALDELEVLKLEEYAFMGESWQLDNIVFRQLRFLRIGRTNLVSWTTSASCFPVLEALYLSHCTGLNAVPSDLVDVVSFKRLELFCTNKKAANSAREIVKLKRDKGNAQSSRFELSIYPPDH